MRFKKVLPYNLSRLLPILAIAGGSFLSSCEKEEIPTKDVDLKFFQDYYEEIEPANIQKHIDDPTVRTIYLSVVNQGYYENYGKNGVANLREVLLQPRIEMAPEKIRGKGNFKLTPGLITEADSLWFVQNGWTINKQNQKQK